VIIPVLYLLTRCLLGSLTVLARHQESKDAEVLVPGPGVVRDLPDRGGGDRVAETDEFALHPPVSPCGVFVAMRITSLRIAAAVDGRP
jgi:hypothetical protein